MFIILKTIIGVVALAVIIDVMRCMWKDGVLKDEDD